MPDIVGSWLWPVGLVSVLCDWVRKQVYSATFSVWQHIEWFEQSFPEIRFFHGAGAWSNQEITMLRSAYCGFVCVCGLAHVCVGMRMCVCARARVCVCVCSVFQKLERKPSCFSLVHGTNVVMLFLLLCVREWFVIFVVVFWSLFSAVELILKLLCVNCVLPSNVLISVMVFVLTFQV